MKNSKLISSSSTLVLAIFISLLPLLVKIQPHIAKISINWVLPKAIAQDIRPEEVAEEVYKLIPSLPRENQYLSQETGEVDLDNTLMSRLVRYHEYVKNRPLKYRLDWKLTLADYFGINEPIRDFRYPGSSTLQLNPLEGDRAIITSLSRRQRNELVDTLVSIYNGQQQNSSTSNSPTLEDRPPSSNSNPIPRLPQPGDAELLLP